MKMKRFIVGLLVITLVLGLSSGAVFAKSEPKVKTLHFNDFCEQFKLKVNEPVDWVFGTTKFYDADPRRGKYKWKKRKNLRVICAFVHPKVKKKSITVMCVGEYVLLKSNGKPMVKPYHVKKDEYRNWPESKPEHKVGGKFYIYAYKYGQPHTKENLVKKWRVIADANKKGDCWPV
jgi:hypothetical protein